VQIPWQDFLAETWRLVDAFSGATYDRGGDEMLNPGLYVELGPWNFNCFQCGRLQSPAKSVGKKQFGTTIAVADR
jgi:hypothetical protein